jgi:hypothetical protein
VKPTRFSITGMPRRSIDSAHSGRDAKSSTFLRVKLNGIPKSLRKSRSRLPPTGRSTVITSPSYPAAFARAIRPRVKARCFRM